MMNITIDNIPVEVEEKTTLMDACRQQGIKIPSLCSMKDISHNASCAICVVEVEGARSLARACVTQVREGMEIITNNPRIQEARRVNIELLLANHPADCFYCERNQNCELQKISLDLGISDKRFARIRPEKKMIDDSSPSIIRDAEKCILCGRCVAVCREMQTVNAIDFYGRGTYSHIGTFLESGLGNVACMNCGQCALVCPTGAITEKSHVNEVWKALNDPGKMVVVQTAPAIRVGIGEAMDMPAGSLVTGKMAAGLRRLGFDKVFDTQFAADLTIIEEGNELLQRIKNGGTLPMITSCSPGWIKFIEHFYPMLLGHLSTCKSPQQMFGAIAKTYYAEKNNINPQKMVVVSVMPCTAKKFEARRPEMNAAFEYWKGSMLLRNSDNFPDVDYAITTRELARMFKEAGIDFANLKEEDFDHPLGTSTGAGTIFGATGGVMEAALRTTYELYTGRPLPKLEFEAVRGMEGIKSADVDLDGTKIKVAVAHTLKNARQLLAQIERGQSLYAFIEVMTCPGGCLGGGGQPIPSTLESRMKRAESLYIEDLYKGIRKSHENPDILNLYTDFLDKPLGELSHHLLHTHYIPRGY